MTAGAAGFKVDRLSIVARLFRRITDNPTLVAARAMEASGEIESAASAYERAGARDDARRLLGVLLDIEMDPRKRVALLGRLTHLFEGHADGNALRLRYAQARLELARLQPQATRLTTEIRALARELTALGEHASAADAFRLAGDREAEAGALVEAGNYVALEALLGADRERERREQARNDRLSEVRDLAAVGQRRAALARAEAICGAEGSVDPSLSALAGSLRTRLCSSTSVLSLEVDGTCMRWAFGDEVLLGRLAACAIAVASLTLSRRHLRFFRTAASDIAVADLGTDNGTWLVPSGARLSTEPLLVRGPLELRAADVLLKIEPHPSGGIVVDVAGCSYRLPLGTVSVGPWRVEASANGLRLVTPEGAPTPLLGDVLAARDGIDLCVGDEMFAARGGPRILVVRSP